MKQVATLIAIIFIYANILIGQDSDIELTSSETGNQIHVAGNSITFKPIYQFRASIGEAMHAIIHQPYQNAAPVYGGIIDPETRSLNTTTYLVGATNGSFSVDLTGAATYTIPIQVEPGVNGLTPSLSLVYSGNTGSGIAGYGWNLAGISAVSRAPKDFYHDGVKGPLEFNYNDRYEIGGQRLISTAGAYGKDGTMYQTEIDDFSRITSIGSCGNGPVKFKAETKSGLIYEYGGSGNSQQKITGHDEVLNWYNSTINDMFGNQISYAYLHDNSNLYPSVITYGPNKIYFYYKMRDDITSTYLCGVKIIQNYILDHIEITYNDYVIKTYKLKYNIHYGLYNSYSILNEVVECGLNDSQLNSTAFKYQLPENVSFTQTNYNETHDYVSYKSLLCTGDINGDGKTDFVCLPDPNKVTWTGIRVYYGDGNDNFNFGFSETTTIDLTQLKDIRTLDINADGKDDLLYQINSSFYYMLYYEGSFTSPEYIESKSFNNNTGLSGIVRRSIGSPLSQQDDNEISGADYNGDGVNDIFLNTPDGDWIIKSLANSSGQISSTLLTLGSGTITSLADEVLSGDFNGDGKTDIWSFQNDGMNIYTLTGSTLCLLYNSTWPSKNHFFNLGDFNADGKVDIFLYGYKSGSTEYDWSNWQVQFSTGTGFEEKLIAQKKTNLKDDYVRLGDFNGDGTSDLMVSSSDESWTGTYFYISQNKGNSFYTHSLPGYPASSHSYYLGDFNGDGRADFLCTDGESPWWIGYQIYKTIGNASVQMEKIGNGLGYLTKLTYTKLSEATNSIYQRGVGATFPVSDFQGPLSVVSSVQYDNGCGTLNTQNYYYEGAKIHMQGKAFLGFAKTRLTDVASGLIFENTRGYNTTYFYPMLTGSSKRLTGQTNPFETTTSIWAQKVLDATQKRIFPYIQSSTQTNSITTYSVAITADYDNYGNPSTVTKTYENGVTETATNIYENIISSTKWLLGRPTTTTSEYSDNETTITRTGTRVFNSNNNLLTSETWNSGTNVEIKNEYEYFTNGNLKKQTATDVNTNTARATQYTYDSDNIRVKGITDPLTHTSTNTYDAFGRFYSQQDYLGNTVTYQYDNMGRQTQVSNSDGSSASTVYAWESPTGTPLLARYSIQSIGNDGAQTKVWHDVLGRKIRSDVKGFDGSMVYSSTEYNTKGQVYRASEPYLTEAATWNVMSYDSYGRKTSIITPSGRNSTWSYNTLTSPSVGYLVTETTDGIFSMKYLDVDGSVVYVNDNGGIINYTYYPDGKIKTITAPGNIITIMQYDIAGNQTQLVDPSAGTMTYLYNGFGELTNQQNGRNQTTQLSYYPDGRSNQKISSVEGNTTYAYNADKQLTGISSPEGISRSYGYDPEGRINSIGETIDDITYYTNFTYDNLGRLSTITHPSNITETNIYNSNGYLASIAAGGSTRWTTLAMNSRGQTTSGTYGSSLAFTEAFNSFGYSTSTITGSLQRYQYEFNPVNGNLNWRKNVSQSNIQEFFYYDGLNRLDYVQMGTTTTLDMAYESNKGGITTKTDIGTLQYNLSGKPYQLGSINCSTGLITSSMDKNITYTSFENISTIAQGDNMAAFTYNADNQRAKMVINQSGSAILTRLYPSSSFIKETANDVTKEFTFIGGDAYSAPVVAVTQSGTTTYYNVLRDHLGSITHVVNAADNTLAAEYSYDAWGRMRDPVTWVPYAPGSEPYLMIAGRGYTGHEQLPWFNLINMNGRVYDPLTGQFLSPDDYNQAPGFTQSYNRYGYCLNNPLKYTDPSGEKINWRRFFTFHFLLDPCSSSISVAATAGTLGVSLVATSATFHGTMLSMDLTSSLFLSDPQKAAERLENAIDIELGMFQYDKDYRGIGDVWNDIWQVGARFSPWESSQSLFGNGRAHWHNMTGNVEDVHYFHGATVLEVNKLDKAGTNLGGCYIAVKDYESEDGGIRIAGNGNLSEFSMTLIHEYGHYRQSRIYGPIGYYAGGINSLFHPDDDEDSRAWFERDACNQGYYYFRDFTTGRWNFYDLYGNQGIDYLGLLNLLFL